MQRFFDHARYGFTGGLHSRDMVFYACWSNDNRCNDVMRQVDAGGPIDAPDILPAGACDSITWHDGLQPRKFRASVSTLRRDTWAEPDAQETRSRQRWYCMACGRLSSIGDKPVRNPCRCSDLGD
jgi:hypothetical protein